MRSPRENVDREKHSSKRSANTPAVRGQGEAGERGVAEKEGAKEVGGEPKERGISEARRRMCFGEEGHSLCGMLQIF